MIQKKKETKRNDKKKRQFQSHTGRRWFKSVTSTGYKWYFYQFWLMWSCCARKTEKPSRTSHLFGLMWACLTVARFESFFSRHIFVYLCNDTWWMNTLFKLQCCLGETEQRTRRRGSHTETHRTSVAHFNGHVCLCCILYLKLSSAYRHFIVFISHYWL